MDDALPVGPIDDPPSRTSLRGYIERNSIALLSNLGKPQLDPPSPGWLGRSCDRGKGRVKASGLWNQNHVDESYDPALQQPSLSGACAEVRHRACVHSVRGMGAHFHRLSDARRNYPRLFTSGKGTGRRHESAWPAARPPRGQRSTSSAPRLSWARIGARRRRVPRARTADSVADPGNPKACNPDGRRDRAERLLRTR
jgi:hypothetical protein